MIRKAIFSDAETIAKIYNYYIRNTIITFEEQEVSSDEISNRMDKVLSESLPWIVAEESGNVVGYAYATKWKVRSAYRFTVESTVYVEPNNFRRGIGSELYDTLLKLLKEVDVHTILGGIALPNPSSVAIHEKFGFTKSAHFKEVGMKFNKWIDVGYWQLCI